MGEDTRTEVLICKTASEASLCLQSLLSPEKCKYLASDLKCQFFVMAVIFRVIHSPFSDTSPLKILKMELLFFHVYCFI